MSSYIVKSFNDKSNFNKNTKILIVGTLTSPEGIAHGYFYSSSRNLLFSKLTKMFDKDIGETEKFVYLKKKLICETDQNIKDATISDINSKLEKLEIAFFDVVKWADRGNKPYSSSDDDYDIIDYDKKTYFSRKENLKGIIFTSRRAKEMFEEIDDEFKESCIIMNLSRKRDNCPEVLDFYNKFKDK